MKDRFFEEFYGSPKALTQKTNIILNFFFCLSCLLLSFFPVIKPDDIGNLNGAICCFFMVY